MFSTTKSVGGAASVVGHMIAQATIVADGARADENPDENPDENRAESRAERRVRMPRTWEKPDCMAPRYVSHVLTDPKNREI